MIAQNLSGKLEGTFHDALQAFATRTGATKTLDAIKFLIANTPEYQALRQLNIRENANASVQPQPIETDNDQENKDNLSVGDH